MKPVEGPAHPHLGLLCVLHVLCSEKFFHGVLARVANSVIPAKAGIQNYLKNLDSGSRFACPE